MARSAEKVCPSLPFTLFSFTLSLPAEETSLGPCASLHFETLRSSLLSRSSSCNATHATRELGTNFKEEMRARRAAFVPPPTESTRRRNNRRRTRRRRRPIFTLHRYVSNMAFIPSRAIRPRSIFSAVIYICSERSGGLIEIRCELRPECVRGEPSARATELRQVTRGHYTALCVIS